MSEIFSAIEKIVWGPILVYGCLLAGVWFSIRTRFAQVRKLGEMARLLFKGHSSSGGISSFQAFNVALSGRVGTGNLVGVASAIGYGGPGAVVWMWIIAFLGASSAFIEATLAQIYKEEDAVTKEYRGGPAYYIEKGILHKGIARVFATLFAITTIVSTGLFLPGIQAQSIIQGVGNAFGINRLYFGIALTVILAVIIWGGIHRIAHVAEFVVPFMALLYILIALIVIIAKFDQIPAVFSLMVSSAFGRDAAFGGMIGSAISWGVKRGVLSSEAGQGSAPHASAAAEVSHPAKQGLVQAFSVYIDTLLICSATAFIIISTGAYNVFNSSSNEMTGTLTGPDGALVEPGIGYLQIGLSKVFPESFAYGITAIMILLFAFTTVMAYYYQTESNVAYLNNRHGHRPIIIHIARAFVIISIFHGTQVEHSAVWTLGDLGVGLMAWLNVTAILILYKPALLALKDYEKKMRAKQTDVPFDNAVLGLNPKERSEVWDFQKSV